MTPIRMEKIEFAMRTVLAYLEAVNRRDASASADFLAESCVWEAAGEPIAGREAIRRKWEAIFQASPDFRFEVEEVFGSGERCVLRWKGVGDAASLSQGPARGVDIYRVRDGAILEIFSYRKV